MTQIYQETYTMIQHPRLKMVLIKTLIDLLLVGNPNCLFGSRMLKIESSRFYTWICKILLN